MSFGQQMETKTLHFGLTYVPGHELHTFSLYTGEVDHPVKRHTDATRAEHRLKNRFLAALSDEQLKRITHFAEDAKLPADVARLCQLRYPIPGSPLPGLAGYLTYIPTEARLANRRSNLQRVRGRPHTLLSYLGTPSPLNLTANLADDDLLTFWADGD